MAKRDHSQMNGVDAETSRPKRRKEMAVAGSSSDVEISSDPVGGEDGDRGVEDVRAQGMKLWHVVREAAKDGRILSNNFFRKPSKKLWPNYYDFIKHPIGLEDIRKQLESGHYPTLEAVRQDFELCFENAKSYNMKDSDIWKDAKELLKLTNKTYNKMVPSDEDGQHAGKKPSLHRLLKTRLLKIIDKTDDTGRILSNVFMELPSKKLWPSYYVQIKRPQCLEAILKRLKRKEYLTATDFADDVELVFSNAMAFNQDHTEIWEDALNLRDTFRQLMSDLPSPFAVARYQKPSNGKIKIKMPAVAAAGPASSPPATNPPVVLRVPGSSTAKAATPVVGNAPLPAPTPPPPAVPPTLPPNTLPSSNMIQVAPQPSAPTYINSTTATFAHYPNASYVPGSTPSTPVAVPTPTPVPAPTTVPAVVNPPPPKIQSVSNSPAPPPLHPSHLLKGVSLMTEPRKRPLILDHRDGVKTWVMRLGPGEHAVSIANVTYMGDEEEDSSEEEDDGEDIEEEEDADEMDVDVPAKNGKKKGKGKARSPRKGKTATATVKALQAARAAKKEARKIGEVQVKLNGLVVAEKDPGSWQVDLQPGTNLLEVGEKGGLIWKVYAERLAI
ncbi:Bromodomain-containing protein [Mycena sp. CBHHK59/15]|nr:Bromodomain-containing protein [Mycena sp. CBHHK59/15]